MRVLSKEVFIRTEEIIMERARSLEKARFKYFFKMDSVDAVFEELNKYQNSDGGFGHGLEPDFKLPGSTPLATTIAFQIFDEIDNILPNDMILNAIRYLENNFNQDRDGWFAVTEKINNFPHAPWWHFDNNKQMTVIDQHWGNPTAEIIGYLYKYRKYIKELDINQLFDYAMNYFNKKEAFASEHEVYCFIRLYHHLLEHQQILMEPKLKAIVNNLVCTDPGQWEQYKPQPLHFLVGKKSADFGINFKHVEENLTYLIDSLDNFGFIKPNWSWGQYEKDWEIAKKEWTGILTFNALKLLAKYNRIENIKI